MSDLAIPKFPEYYFFYAGFLSQWYPSKFTDKDTGIKYLCAEQYMMAQKARLFGDNETADSIMNADHPKIHKSLGRGVKGFDIKLWDEWCRPIVYMGNFYKFSQNAHLLVKLLKTDYLVLVEASPYDRIWGIGFSADVALDHRKEWGEDRLGRILTNLRKDFQNEVPKRYNFNFEDKAITQTDAWNLEA